MSTNKYILAKDVKDWNGVTTITSPSGQTKTVEEVLKNYPDYKVLVDSNNNIIKGNISTNRKSTPAQDYRFLENIVKNDPNGPYAATNWLLTQLAMLPLSAIGTVAAPIAITAGGIVGGVAGDIGGHYLSDWLYENPDKPIEIFGKDVGITPRTATRIGGGLVGGFAGGAGAYVAQEKLVKPYLIAREINRMPLVESNELPSNVGLGPKQTIAVSHKSNNPNELLSFNFNDIFNEVNTVGKFRKFAGTHKYKVTHPVSEYKGKPLGKDVITLISVLKRKGFDLSKIDVEDVKAAISKRESILQNHSGRYTIASPTGATAYIDGDEIGSITLDRLFHGYRGINYVHKIKPEIKHVSEQLYNAGIETSKQAGYKGIFSGESLNSPSATRRIWRNYPDKELLSVSGAHHFRDRWFYGQPIYGLPNPSATIYPTKSVIFDPDIIDLNGIMHVDWNNPDIAFKNGGKLNE